MAINKNHEFEELDGVKCAVVEKNASAERAEFLRQLLAFNKYTVMVVASPPPKPAPAAPKPAAAPVEGAETPQPEVPATPPPPPPPATFTVGVTDVRFNAINAIFGRMLKTPDGHVVTNRYWLQQEAVSDDSVPYYEKA